MPAGAIAGASAASGLAGAAIQSSAANDASKSAQNAANNSLNFQKDVYSNAQANLNPYAQQGQSANTALGGLLGLNGDAASGEAFKNYLGSTNYNFVKDQGLKGIEYANAPAFLSGGTGKALSDYSQNMANNALSGYEGMLGNQAGLGVTAASALNGVGTGLAAANNIANQYGANAQGQAATATGNAWTNALKNVGGSLSSYVGNSAGQQSASPYGALTNFPSVAANSPTIGALNTNISVPTWS